MAVAAADEQAFTRNKHDPDFPVHSIRWGCAAGGVDQARSTWSPSTTSRWSSSSGCSSATSRPSPALQQFVKGMPGWFSTKLRLDKLLSNELGYKGPIIYGEHHLSHAASAFYCRGWEEAAILTVDGVGEWATATWGVGRDDEIELMGGSASRTRSGCSTAPSPGYLGFKVNSAEYKVMGLAAYGEPLYVDQHPKLIHVAPDGTFRLDMRYFAFDHGVRMFNAALERLIGAPTAPLEGAPLEQFHKDVAALAPGRRRRRDGPPRHQGRDARRGVPPPLPRRRRGAELWPTVTSSVAPRWTTSSSSPPPGTPAGPWARRSGRGMT